MVAVPAALAPVVYGLLNIASATGIVFANKAGERVQPLPARAPCGTCTPASRASKGPVVQWLREQALRCLGTAAAARRRRRRLSAPLRPACRLQSSASSSSTSRMRSRSYTRSPHGRACKASCG